MIFLKCIHTHLTRLVGGRGIGGDLAIRVVLNQRADLVGRGARGDREGRETVSASQARERERVRSSI